MKEAKLIGVIILVGFSIGFIVLLIDNFSSFGKSQVTDNSTTLSPCITSTTTEEPPIPKTEESIHPTKERENTTWMLDFDKLIPSTTTEEPAIPPIYCL